MDASAAGRAAPSTGERQPPRTAYFTSSALPVPLTPLIGRLGMVEATRALLGRAGVRLVTLSGSGGVGKTRLALRAAAECEAEFPDGVVFVGLASITDPDLVLPMIARALDLHEAGERSLLEVLEAALRGRRLLLVLDNLEQVIAVAPTVADLLVRCPDLKVLATSRIVLRVTGEWDLQVPPLALPGPDLVAPADLLAVDSIGLFVERARAADADFALSEENSAAVAEICRRLDALPLALELAAARLRHLPIDALLDRLEPRLPLLAGGPRDQPARLRTMRAAIGWSYDLLSPADQQLFRRLAILSGGFSVAAAKSISESEDDLSTLDGIARLVDCSLVRREHGGDRTRFAMLETVREYGLEQLAARGELRQVRQRHADWCLDLVKRAWPAFAARVNQEPWLDRLAAEHDNLRAALGWLIQEGEAGAAARLAGAMFWFWFVRSHVREGRTWLDRVLAMPGIDTAAPTHLARAYLGAGLLSHFQGDDQAATALVTKARQLARDSDFAFGQAAASLTLGIIAEDRGDYGAASPYLDEALAVARQAGDRANESLALYHRGVMSLGQGDREQAAARCEEALAIQREIGDRWGTANSLAYLGLVLGEIGDHGRAAAMLQESLETRRALGTPEDIANGIANVATLAATCGEPALAARLFGAEEALREGIGSFRKLPERTIFERAESAVRAALGPDAFATMVSQGRSLTGAGAVDLALSFETTDAAVPRQDEVARHERLTERELEVLTQLARGKTNPEIAIALYISPGTVRTHVSSILSKLGARTRTEAADLARRRGTL